MAIEGPGTILPLASGIVTTEFDYITGAEAETEVFKVSGWLGANVGQLNTLLYTTFYSGDGGPKWKQEEQAIYTQIYLQDYYNKQARIILRKFTSDSVTASGTNEYSVTPWTVLREGDTTIQREIIKTTASARTEAARALRGAADAAEQKIRDLVYKYNYYQATPSQVAGNDG
jgi:hypothetical protein